MRRAGRAIAAIPAMMAPTIAPVCGEFFKEEGEGEEVGTGIEVVVDTSVVTIVVVDAECVHVCDPQVYVESPSPQVYVGSPQVLSDMTVKECGIRMPCACLFIGQAGRF